MCKYTYAISFKLDSVCVRVCARLLRDGGALVAARVDRDVLRLYFKESKQNFVTTLSITTVLF